MENTPSPPSQTTTLGLPKARVLFRLAFDYHKEHFNVIASVMLVPFMLQLPGIFFGSSAIAAFCSVVGIFATLLSTVILLGLMVGGWNKDDGIDILYQKSFKWILPLILINAYVMLAIVGGFFMLIIPGIYAAICLGFSMYFLFAENKQGMAALVASWHHVRGYWGAVLWRMVVLWLLFAFIGLLFAAISIGPYVSTILENIKNPAIMPPEIQTSPIIGLVSSLVQYFALGPVALLYTAFMFKALHALKPTMSEEDTQKTQKTVKMFMTVGLIGLLLVITLSGFFIMRSVGSLNGSPRAPIDSVRR